MELSSEADTASIVRALLTAHDAEAHLLLDRMRQGRGTLEALDLCCEEDQTDKVPTLLPPDQTSFEFELMIRHPMAFPALAPLDSHIETATSLDQIQSASDSAQESGYTTASDLETKTKSNTEAPRVGEFESRLRKVHFARWTQVPVSGSEAASAITYYLDHDHVILRLFDTELFLADLSSGEENFCSSLLVDALLGWSLVSNNYRRRKNDTLNNGTAWNRNCGNRLP